MKNLQKYRPTQIVDQVRTGGAPTPALRRDIGRDEFFPVANRKKQAEIIRVETTVLEAGIQHLDAERRFMETGIDWVRTYAKTQQLPEILANDRANLRHEFDMDGRRREIEREMRPALLRAGYEQDLQTIRAETAKLIAEEAGWRHEQALHEVQAEGDRDISTQSSPENQSPTSELGELLHDAENLDVSSDQTRQLVHKLRVAIERQTLFSGDE